MLRSARNGRPSTLLLYISKMHTLYVIMVTVLVTGATESLVVPDTAVPFMLTEKAVALPEKNSRLFPDGTVTVFS